MEIRLIPCIMRSDDVLGREGSGFLKTRIKYPNTSLTWKNSITRFIMISSSRPQ
jgi:hypothetical protein